MSTIVRCNEIFEGHKLKRLTLESRETDVEKYLSLEAIEEPNILTICIALEYKCSMQKLRWYLERGKNSDPKFIDGMSKHFLCYQEKFCRRNQITSRLRNQP
jgi:hypothetical protein